MKKIEANQMGELFSLLISILIIGFVIIYLIWNIAYSPTDYMDITGEAALEESLVLGEYHVMPIEIKNNSDRTIDYIKLNILTRYGADDMKEQEAEIDYLSSHSSQKIFMYYDAPVSSVNIKVEPLYYKFK